MKAKQEAGSAVASGSAVAGLGYAAMKANKEPHGVYLDENLTTMQVPHRRIDRSGGCCWYVAAMPEGDQIIHEWSPRDCGGYGGDWVTFLMEDGNLETVQGPYSCSDAFDHGRLKSLKQYGYAVAGPAFRIVVGRNINGFFPKGPREVLFEEPRRACGDLAIRLAHATARTLPVDYEVVVRYRGSDRMLRPDDVQAILREAEHGGDE